MNKKNQKIYVLIVTLVFLTIIFSGCVNKNLVKTMDSERQNNKIILKGRAINSKIVKPMTQQACFCYDTVSHDEWLDYKYTKQAKIISENGRFIYFELELELGKDIEYNQQYHFRAGMYYCVDGDILPDEPVMGEDFIFET